MSSKMYLAYGFLKRAKQAYERNKHRCAPELCLKCLLNECPPLFYHEKHGHLPLCAILQMLEFEGDG